MAHASRVVSGRGAVFGDMRILAHMLNGSIRYIGPTRLAFSDPVFTSWRTRVSEVLISVAASRTVIRGTGMYPL